MRRKELRTITLTIDENGDQKFLKSDGAEMFRELGITVTRRASHVEPDAVLLRVLFHVIRSLVTDASAVAAWTRRWRCVWRINTAPLGGPILGTRFTDRQAAIAHEIWYVNTFLFTGRI